MGWYSSNCDGDWEHDYGVTISTIDNPGWSLLIALEGTDMDGLQFETVERSSADTLKGSRCWVKDNKFQGAGGPYELAAMIQVFRTWVLTTNPLP